MIDEATITAIVVMAQRKTKCLICEKVIRILLYQTRARNCLPTARRAVNGLKSSTPINLCLKRAKLSKLKLEEDLPRQGKRSRRWMSRFVFALILFRNAGADSHCLATPTRTGSKPSGSSSPNQARVEVEGGRMASDDTLALNSE